MLQDFMKGKTLLVTGATGFLAKGTTHILQLLTSKVSNIVKLNVVLTHTLRKVF